MDMPLDARPLRLRHDWPGGMPLRRADPAAAAREADVARRFEALIAATLLRSARAASLGDDGLGAAAAPVRDMIDNSRAEAIARAAPMGVARLLQRERMAPTEPRQ